MLAQNRFWLRSLSAATIMTGSATVASPSAEVNAQWLAGRLRIGAASVGGGHPAGCPGLAGMPAVAAATSA
ncbi:MAG TPA: hypothetical protein VFV73_40025 [Streptosporangiaceae bacterium]|nr:hypothetical protein [Streptosporangiaceae bacterium]